MPSLWQDSSNHKWMILRAKDETDHGGEYIRKMKMVKRTTEINIILFVYFFKKSPLTPLPLQTPTSRLTQAWPAHVGCRVTFELDYETSGSCVLQNTGNLAKWKELN